MKINLFTIAIIVGLTGCASQGTNTRSYVVGKPEKLNNEIIIPEGSSSVWDVLVKNLSRSFFSINNIDKESRIINVSFSTQKPSGYVDCGRTHRTYTQGSNVEHYDYEVAEKSKFKAATTRQEHPAFVNYVIINRETSLEGKANIYVAPDDKNPKNSTIVTVNVRYILTIKTSGDAFAEHISGSIQQRGSTPTESNAFGFNTNKPETIDLPDGGSLTCFSKGLLESDILSLTKR